MSTPQKFPEDIQCIVEPVKGCGGIYVSNIEAAQNPLTLKRLDIEAVITAIKGKNLDKVIPSHIQYLYIPAIDHQSFDISYYFEQSNKFIHQERKRTNVLVHCMAGISRSVTLVIAYLMKHQGQPFHSAFSHVKLKRKIIHPNDSFLTQLRAYEAQLRPPLGQKKLFQSNVLTNTSNFGKIKTCNLSALKEPKNAKTANYDQNLKENIKNLFKHKSLKNSAILS